MNWFSIAFLVFGGLGLIAVNDALPILTKLIDILWELIFGSNVECELVLNKVLEALPQNTSSLLASASFDKCSTAACGQPDGSGYWDIYCNAQCVAALYTTGTCANNPTTGSTSCTCAGGNGQQNIQTVLLICEALGSCACQTCKNGTGAFWSEGTCTQIPNGVQNSCGN